MSQMPAFTVLDHQGMLSVRGVDAAKFLQGQLKPELLQAAAAEAGHPLTLRMQPGYDHSYYCIASFIGDHIAHHAAALKA